MKTILATLLALLSLPATVVHAAPVLVDYTISGSANDWTYDFTVRNAIGGGNQIYFFAVDVTGGTNTTLTGVPTGWDNAYWDTPWTSAPSGLSYGQVWFTASNQIASGSGLSGFTVHDQSAAPATTVAWTADAEYGLDLNEDGHFGIAANPGFDGTATPAAVPEPGTWAFMLVGLGVIGFALRRRPHAVARAMMPG